jgi:HSP20 family molecular chaperone IbpA
MLTIRGKKRTERDEHNKDKNWHVVERSLWLVQPSKAKFDKGVLHIHLPSQRSWHLVGFVTFLPL